MKLFLKGATLLFFIGFTQFAVAQETIRINTLSKINEHADQVGIWINTITDDGNATMEERLRELNMKSIRYGWQYGGFDINDFTGIVAQFLGALHASHKDVRTVLACALCETASKQHVTRVCFPVGFIGQVG